VHLVRPALMEDAAQKPAAQLVAYQDNLVLMENAVQFHAENPVATLIKYALKVPFVLTPIVGVAVWLVAQQIRSAIQKN